MKIDIEADEFYPFYDIWENVAYARFDVPDTTVKRWRRVMREFYIVQDQMSEYYEDKF